MRFARTIAVTSFALFLMASSASAVDPNARISQYAHTAWRIQDGAFEGTPNTIAQTTDGYLWIGTEAGLVRFDGVRFVPWTPPPGQKLNGSTVYALLGSADGALWIGTNSGLNRWKANTLTVLSLPGRINQIIQDREGKIWATRSRTRDSKGGFCQLAGDQVQCFGTTDGLNLPNGGPMAEDGAGNLWIGTSDLLMRWRPGSFKHFFTGELKGFSGLSSVQAVVSDNDGSVWAGVSTKEVGLQHIINGEPVKVAVPGLDTSQITSLRVDRDGSRWIGTFKDGLYRLYDKQVDHIGTADGLSSNVVLDIFLDREGGLWVVTSKGIDHFRDNRVLTFSTREGLSTDRVSSLLASRDGTVWIGNHEALDFLKGDQHGAIRRGEGLPGRRVTALAEDHAGRLWVGIDNSLMVYTAGVFQKIKDPEGKWYGAPFAMAEDRDQNVWVSTTRRRLYRIRDLRLMEEIDEAQVPFARVIAPDPVHGIWIGGSNGAFLHYQDGKVSAIPLPRTLSVTGIAIDTDGSVWAATPGGLFQWKNGRLQTLGSANGLPCDAIVSVVRDDQASLWLYAKCGVIAISDAELKRWEKQPSIQVQSRLFDRFDGAQPGDSSFQPAASKSPDGRLWFENDLDVQMIDPAHLRTNDVPPPVHIERIIADRTEYPIAGNLRLPARTRDLEIDYTALSLLIPQKVRFRYKLEGRDSQWQDAGTRRQVFYNDLPPSQYRFRVIAANNDGIWNETGASVEFSILPAYYQTTWFRLLCAGALIGLLAIAYRFRVRQIAADMNTRFNERLAERTRLARDLHDTLLQTIQGSKMVADDALEESETNDAARMRTALQRLSEWLGQAIDEGRSALNSLRTSTTERNDLSEAFHRAVEECRFQRDIEFDVSVQGSGREMHPIVRDEVYRIGYEAIRNACLHSGGSHLSIELSYLGDLVLRVRDNGGGIAPEVAAQGRSGHFGLVGMYERASRLRGKLTVSSSPGAGTQVELVVPRNIVFQRPEPVKNAGLARIFGLLRKRDSDRLD